MDKLKIGTLFSGGLAAVEWAMKYENIEHEIVFACEWDKYARKQYLEFHGEPTSNFYEDVSDMDGKPYSDAIDLMVWGSPCQDLSLAGKRKGFDGEKSSLFREGARIMSEVMPKAFIFENVKGLLSSNSGADYKEVEKTFRELGYHMAMKVVNAKEQGTAQNRERVFVVGFLDLDEYHDFHFADSVPLTKCLRDYLEDEVDEKYYLSQESCDRMIKSPRSVEPGTINTKISPCLIAGYGKIPTDGFYIKDFCLNPDGIAKTLRVGGRGSKTAKHNFDLVKIKSATKQGFEVATENDSINFTHPDSKTRRGRVGHGVAQTLDCACNQGVIEPTICEQRTDEGLRFFNDNICGTIRTIDSGGDKRVIENFRIRKLTPRECFRLMGMNDEDIVLVNSDTQSYKIAGNGIEINTMRSIIRQLYRPTKPKGNLF